MWCGLCRASVHVRGSPSAATFRLRPPAETSQSRSPAAATLQSRQPPAETFRARSSSAAAFQSRSLCARVRVRAVVRAACVGRRAVAVTVRRVMEVRCGLCVCVTQQPPSPPSRARRQQLPVRSRARRQQLPIRSRARRQQLVSCRCVWQWGRWRLASALLPVRSALGTLGCARPAPLAPAAAHLLRFWRLRRLPLRRLRLLRLLLRWLRWLPVALQGLCLRLGLGPLSGPR